MAQASDPRSAPRIDPRTPVIVGAGQCLDRGRQASGSREPVAMMVQALRRAGADSGAGERLLRRADSVRCVPVIGWRYPAAAALVAEDLGLRPRDTAQSAEIGGDGPLVLINDTARAILAGRLEVALLAGAEAVASVRAARRQGRALAWRQQDEQARPSQTLGDARAPVNDAEQGAGLMPPVFMYALIENALRATLRREPEAHLERIAELWARFSRVAAENPCAWIKRAYSPAQIATPSHDNRLVASPYTKLLTANIDVNMATGLIVTRGRAARAAGVPLERWVFVHAGAQAQDEWHVSERHALAASPAIRALGAAALRHTGRAIDEIAHIDLYSCFPAAVEVAAGELGLDCEDARRPLTVTGGLTFAGGPGNNYTSHAVARLIELLRADADAYGLASAVGWYLTKHALSVFSARPPGKPFASFFPDPRRAPARRALRDHAGPATLEAYTVTYGRDGTPEAALISALTARGERAVMRSGRREVIDALLAADPLGWSVKLGAGERLTLELAGPELPVAARE